MNHRDTEGIAKELKVKRGKLKEDTRKVFSFRLFLCAVAPSRRCVKSLLIPLLFLLFLLSTQHSALSTQSDCGIVDAIDFPIDGLVEGYDDFARYRARFGGNHTGLDIGFDRWGDPVRAVARGEVTYSDVEGWDTEKGVVIVRHTFPDGSIAFSLYGHMEQTDTLFFPSVGRCVERGDILGGIGWPSRGRPHLHYEIRSFLPDDGGPGYITGNPLEEGWYHPLDFTLLWQARLSPGFVNSVTFDHVPGLPPVALDSGLYALASDNLLQGVAPDGRVLWQVEMDGVVTGLAALPGDRVVAHTRDGQAVTIQGGRYAALWTVEGPDEPFVVLGETLVFVTEGGGLAAYDVAGNLLWTMPGINAGRVLYFQANGQQIALGLRGEGGVMWRLVDAAGQILYERDLDRIAAAAPQPDGQWLVLNGSELNRIGVDDNHAINSVSPSPGRSAAMTADVMGNSYLYLGDAQDTLLALDVDGNVRWRVNTPYIADYLPPLLDVGNGCLLYALSVDGLLSVFSTADGTLVTQRQLYAGGSESGSPPARLLHVDTNERVQVGAGFLTMAVLDGMVLGGEYYANCLLG